MPDETISHVAVDVKGIAWIRGTSFKVKDIIEDRMAHGWSPEEIRYQHQNTLTLAQIYAAISFYYDHQKEIDEQIRVEFEYVEKLRMQSNESANSVKLRAHLAQK